MAAKKTTTEKESPLYAAVLIRGKIRVRHDVKQALELLRLRRQHVCVVVPYTQSTKGMLEMCKDLITYGPISPEFLEEMKAKRKPVKGKDGKPLNVFRLHPPRGGYGAKGTKVGFQDGGVLGLRKKSMDEFLRRML